MNAIPTPPASAAAPATESAEERRADRERRLDEAASVLAVTLLDMWRLAWRLSGGPPRHPLTRLG